MVLLTRLRQSPRQGVLGGSIPIHPSHHSLNWQPKCFVSPGALRSACPTPHRAYDRRSNPPRKEKDMAGPVVHKLNEKARPPVRAPRGGGRALAHCLLAHPPLFTNFQCLSPPC